MIGEEFRAFLVSVPGIAAEVVDRVYVAPLPQGAELPALTYLEISDVPSLTNDNNSCYQRARCQLDVWATTRAEAVRIVEIAWSVLHGYTGQWGGHTIGLVRRLNSSQHYEPETKLRRVQTDFMIHVFN